MTSTLVTVWLFLYPLESRRVFLIEWDGWDRDVDNVQMCVENSFSCSLLQLVVCRVGNFWMRWPLCTHLKPISLNPRLLVCTPSTFT